MPDDPSSGNRGLRVEGGGGGGMAQQVLGFAAMTKFVIVVPPDMPETCAELAAALAGEDVSVVADRRRGDRRGSVATASRKPSFSGERRRAERRGTHPPGLIRASRGAGTRASVGGRGGSR